MTAFMSVIISCFAISIFRDIRDGEITRVNGGKGTSRSDKPFRFWMHNMVKIVMLSLMFGVILLGIYKEWKKL